MFPQLQRGGGGGVFPQRLRGGAAMCPFSAREGGGGRCVASARLSSGRTQPHPPERAPPPHAAAAAADKIDYTAGLSPSPLSERQRTAEETPAQRGGGVRRGDGVLSPQRSTGPARPRPLDTGPAAAVGHGPGHAPGRPTPERSPIDHCMTSRSTPPRGPPRGPATASGCWASPRGRPAPKGRRSRSLPESRPSTQRISESRSHPPSPRR